MILGISNTKFHSERKNKKYIEWLKKQTCCNPECKGGGGQVVGAHQRILGNAGIGIKPPDRDALPLCFDCHVLEHRGAITFWQMRTKAKTKKYVQELCDYYIEQFKNL